MLLLIISSTFICATFGILGLYWLIVPRGNSIARRLKSAAQLKEDKESAQSIEAKENLAERIAKPIHRLAPPSAAEGEKLQRQLLMAGYFSHQAPLIYRAIQLASMAGFPILAAGACFLAGLSLRGIMISGLTAFIVGFFLPRFVLKKIIKRRQERLSWGLADALDLMVVSMEAGLGINAALLRVSEELEDPHPEIGAEFEMVNLEIRVGRDRLQALRNLSDRTGVDDLRGFVVMLVQADRFGASIGRAIRIYSEALRTKRRQRAEQAAQKASVKLLLPLTCFLFPTLFIIILGPAALSIMDAFRR